MNDNWLEIIEILASVSKTSDRLTLRRAMESCLRMLGWKTINNSMVVDFKTASGANVDIVLGNKETDGYNVNLPIFIATDINEGNIANVIKAIDSEIGCKSVVTIGQSLNLYFKPDDSEEYVCIKKILFDQDNTYGAKLANILPYNCFNKEKLNSFCEAIYSEVGPNIKLELLLDKIINDKDKAKEVLKTYLELEGLEGEYVDEKLDEIEIDINYQGGVLAEPSPELVSAYTPLRKETGHDRTKFSINGGEMLSKRRFVHAVVSLYVKEHPSVTLEDLERQFPSSIASKERGVVRPYELVKRWAEETSDDIYTRYCTREGEIIRLDDGTEVVVNSQWGAINFPRFLAVAQRLYDIASSEPYCSVTNIQTSNTDATNKRASNFKFSLAGITIGETVIFNATGIAVKVISDNEVEYKGTNYRLSSFVKTFIPDHLRTPSDSYRGPDFFSYKGKTLTELRNSYPKENDENAGRETETSENNNKGIHISVQALNSFKRRK